MRNLILVFVGTVLVCLFVLESAMAQLPAPSDPEAVLSDAYKGKSYSPYAGRGFPIRPYWGDTHLHTGLSLDAGVFGARLGPVEAHRFARGEELISSTGIPVRLSRPLDWLVVADHSDQMGFALDLIEGKQHLLAEEKGREWYDMMQSGEGVAAAMDIIGLFSTGRFPEGVARYYLPGAAPYRATWERVVKAAEQYNEPGRYTAFIGYEWTSLVEANNLHRVVIYRDGGDRALQAEPYTTYPPQGSPNPRDLWKWMTVYEEKTGGDLLALAHNGNLANGIMFPDEAQYDGTALDQEYVEQRIKWEPMYEVTQIKGDGEAHPFLSPNDEFADYETWDFGNFNPETPKKNEMLAGEYAREALKRGLQLERRLGTNPYKFGMVGSTDSHTGLATAQEDNFFGKHSGAEPSPERMNHPFMARKNGDVVMAGWGLVASGLAGVWAEENTREALFDAMKRKEVYATTGSRTMVRFFAGWDFTDEDIASRNPAFLGYRKGVPMGGDLKPRTGNQAPSFMVYALRDPIGGNLDRIQIIKGWMDSSGETHERVYDVAVSDGRTIGADGRCRTPVGNTVDAETANFTNTIGASELATVWTDPDFDPTQKAFYYARVIEIPTPRWSTIEAFRFGIPIPEGAPVSTQERAYTSPIWYTP
jgi:hypothetical protein